MKELLPIQHQRSEDHLRLLHTIAEASRTEITIRTSRDRISEQVTFSWIILIIKWDKLI